MNAFRKLLNRLPKFRSILALAALAIASPTREITDIRHWKHPTKAIFADKGIDVRKVELVDGVKPIFHVTFPVTPSTCDPEGLDRTLRELSVANGSWTYVIVDSSQKGVFMKAEVVGDPKASKIAGIHRIVDPKCSGGGVYRKAVPSPFGLFEIFDQSNTLDNHRYEFQVRTTKVRIETQEFDLDTLKSVVDPSDKAGDAIFLATFVGPGMNCHEKSMILRINRQGVPKASGLFGECQEIQSVTRRDGVVEIRTTGAVRESDRIVYRWSHDTLTESK